MGKKTDEFTKTLTALTADCAVSVASIIDFTKSMDIIKEGMSKAEKAMTARHEHFFPGGHQTNEAELAIEQDPQYRQAAQVSDALAAKLNALFDKKDAAKKELKANLVTLQKKVGEFDAYVKAKEKKWFGGKKSVPAAKASIVASTEYIGKCTPLTR
jgi:hypothetical protein